MTLPTGTLLSQRYEIHDLVGSDGTLEVYKGLDLRLGRDVAVTVLEIKTIHDPEQLIRFEQEAQIRAGLHHPRIMTIHDFGHDASCAFQVAEWLDGHSLRKRLKSGLLDWPEAARIGRAITEGLAVIRGKGFALSALDSTSVFLQRDGGVKLFAYELKRIEGAGFVAAEREALRSLARLLLRSVAGENPIAAVVKQSHNLSTLLELTQEDGQDLADLRAQFHDLLQDEPKSQRRRPGPWIAAAMVLVCVPSLALLYSRRPKPQPAAATQASDPATDSAPPRDTDARRLYQYGMQLLDNRDPESLQRAQTYLQGAITRDPTFASAYSGLADCYSLLGILGALRRDEALRLSEAAIQHALESDPKSGEAHAAKALLAWWYRLDWKGAEQDYLLALNLAPQEASVHHGYGAFLLDTDRQAEGLKHLEMALELQPLSRLYRSDYALYLHWSGRTQESLEAFAKALELDPTHRDTLLGYREVLEQLGHLEEAVSIAQRLSELGVLPDRDASALKTALDSRGPQGYWNERVRQQEHDPEPMHLAAVVALKGDKERALRLLARAQREGSLLAARIPGDPAFESLRPDPRFKQILKHLGYRES